MKENKETSATGLNASFQQPAVCAYACIPDWPEQQPLIPQGWDGDGIVPNPADERVEQLLCEIQDFSKLAGRLDVLGKADGISVCYTADEQLKEVFFAPSGSDISSGIVELIKGYIELEIEKRKVELMKYVKP